MKVSEDSPIQFLQNIASSIRHSVNEPAERMRARTIVEMLRKHRGASSADLFGKWYGDVWLDSPEFAHLQTTNIFQSLVRGAEANFTQAKILLDITAKNGDFVGRSTEKIARSIYEILTAEQWDESAEQKLFYAMALEMNAYVVSRFDRNGGRVTMPMPEFLEGEFASDGEYVCPAGHTLTGSDLEVCPEHNEPLVQLNEPEASEGLLVEFTEHPIGQLDIEILSGLQVSVDDRNGVPADIRSANWVEVRKLVHKNELRRLFKYEPDGSAEWSYQTRLLQGFKRHKNGQYSPETDLDRCYYELRTIWLDPVEYEDYVAPENTKIHNTHIKRGDSFAEMFPDGLVMGLVGQDVVFLEAENKDVHIKSALWLSEGESFYGIGMSAGVGIQQKINQLETIIMEGEARSIKGSLVYNPLAFDGKHLEGANVNIPMRADFATNGQDIRAFIQELKVEGLSEASAAYLANQVDVMQRVMGVPDVALGIGDRHSKTASGQALISQNALGILIPAKKSEGRLKVGWLMDQLRLVQMYYPPEAISRFGQHYGEDWLPEEIEAFCSSDLDRSLSVTVVDGSEIPVTRLERQQKLRADIAAQFIPMTPEIQAQLAMEAGLSGLDINGWESNERLAKKRIAFVFEGLMNLPLLAEAWAQYDAMLTMPDGTPITDEAGNPAMNPIIQQIMTAPELQIVSQAENHEYQFGLWGKKARQVLASAGDAMLTRFQAAICEAMMTRHKLAANEVAARNQVLMATQGLPAAVGMQMTQKAMEGEKENDS